jgi:DNA-binding transcriptional LysR family regulator
MVGMQTKAQTPSGPLASQSARTEQTGADLGSAGRDIAAIWPVGEIIQYCCFVVVAEELHFTRASRRLHMDQSVVSRHIQKLESNLGLKLFVRADRRVELTEAGNAFAPFANKALIAAKAGVRVAQAIAKGDPREFEIAYSPLVDTHLIAQIKELIEGAHPRLPVRFRSVPPETLLERLLTGTSHLAVAILPVDGDVATACILREELFAVFPTAHHLARSSTVTASEIDDAPIVWPSGIIQPGLTEHLFAQFRRQGYVPNVNHEVQTIPEALGLAREGLGLTFVKASDRHLVGDGLILRPLSKPPLIETGVLYVRERRWDLLTHFVSLVTTRFRCGRPGSP